MNNQKLLWKAKIMTIKMARVRGFDLDSTDQRLLNMNFEDFNNWYNREKGDDKLSKHYIKMKDGQIDKVQIFFFAPTGKYDNKVVVGEFHNMIKAYLHPNISVVGTIITDWKLSKNAMDKLNKDYPFFIQTFVLEDFGYDFSTHAFGADYYRVTDINELYKVKINQLPVMRIDDQIAKYYGWTEGTVVAMQFCNISMESVGNTCIEYFRIVK